MHIRFILTDSIAELQNLSSGRFYANTEFMQETNTRVIVITNTSNFNTLSTVIATELDNLLVRRNDTSITYSIYTHLDLSAYYEAVGLTDFIQNNTIHPLNDYFIQYDDYADYIFSSEKPYTFSDILPGIKDDLIVARRLSNGVTICASQLDNSFINVATAEQYKITDSDIFATDWVDSNLTLYPTTVKYDRDNSMCKLYCNLYANKSGLPYSDIFYFITHGKDEYTNRNNVPIFILTKYKDGFNFYKSLLNHIIRINQDKKKLNHIELFDPNTEIEKPVLPIYDSNKFNKQFNLFDEKSKIIIDTDSYDQDYIDSILSKVSGDKVLLISFSEM